MASTRADPARSKHTRLPTIVGSLNEASEANEARGPAQAELLTWYRANARDLPWRRTRDPYRILVSEMMLQQTQVDRVVPFYERFLALFPDERALAAAPLEAIHRAWKGLGYPSRVERLQAACRQVLERGGVWPDTPEGLRELPGIGPYTSGAVACFAFAAAVPIVDTNVARVYARRDGLPMPMDRVAIWPHVAAQVDRGDPIAYNNALMELGALVCKARAPLCDRCPWSARCASRDDVAAQAATSNPLKVASKTVSYGVEVDRSKPRQRIVLALIHHDGRYLVARRKAGAHLGGFWELPGGKREAGEDDRVAVAREVREELGGEVLSARALMTFSHAYPERFLTFHVYRVRLFNPGDVKPLASDELKWVTPAEFIALPFPPANQAVIERITRYHRL